MMTQATKTPWTPSMVQKDPFRGSQSWINFEVGLPRFCVSLKLSVALERRVPISIHDSQKSRRKRSKILKEILLFWAMKQQRRRYWNKGDLNCFDLHQRVVEWELEYFLLAALKKEVIVAQVHSAYNEVWIFLFTSYITSNVKPQLNATNRKP